MTPIDQELSTRHAQSDIPLPWLAAIVLRDRRSVIVCTAVGLAIGVVVALFQATYYSAGFSFTPQASTDQRSSALAGLANQIGISLGSMSGSSTPPQLYADVLKTRGVLAPIAADTFRVEANGKSRPLSEILGISGSDAAVAQQRTMDRLRERIVSTTVDARTTGAVTVVVKTRWPLLSLGLATRLLDGLNAFNRTSRQSQAGEERRFTEGRLAAAQAALRSAEDAMQAFLAGNRQYEHSPSLAFQHDRLQREVMFQQQVVTGLAQQYEDARIREVRDTPVITVIDRPSLPVLADPRGRGRIIAVFTFLGAVAGLAVVILRGGWHRQRIAEAGESSYRMLSEEWQRVRGVAK